MSNDNKTKEVMSTSGAKQLRKAICQEYWVKLDSRAPKAKSDLNFSQIREVMYLNDTTKSKFKKLYFDEKISDKNSLSKWSLTALAEVKTDFKYDNSKEDVDDLQDELIAGYEKWFRANDTSSKKRVSPSNVRVSELLTYMGTVKKDSSLPNLVKDGVTDLTNWKVKNMDMEACNSCRAFLKDKSV